MLFIIIILYPFGVYNQQKRLTALTTLPLGIIHLTFLIDYKLVTQHRAYFFK